MADKQNLLYLYDLPKDVATSVQIAQIIKEKADCEAIENPQIKRDPNKPFYTAIVKINDSNDFKKVAEKIKYFEMQGMPCRALPFDKDLLGSNRNQTNKNTVFVKHISKEIKSNDLEEKFKAIGPVKSAKVSINPDYSSRGYGFVCFSNAEDAKNAIAQSEKLGFEVLPYNPKDRREVRKLYNNIYVKNFTPDWDDAKLRGIFSKFGEIKSLILMKSTRPDGTVSPFAFVCYENPLNSQDKEYGPKCAMNAVTELHDTDVDGCRLYVREALKKAEREQEKKKDQMRFKNSKKRCNLYVKNFPPNTTEQQLREYFGKCGDIESVKIFSKEGEAVYAFVCFKNPDNAALARQQLNQQTFNGKILYINHYEIKEIRKIQQEEIKDKADYNNYKKQNQGTFSLDMINKPEIFSLIQQLIMYMQRSQQPFKQGMGYNRGPRTQGQRPHIQHQQPGTMPKPMQQPGQMPLAQPPMMAPGMQPPMQPPMRPMMPGQMPPQGMPMQMPPQQMMMQPAQAQPMQMTPFNFEYNQRGIHLVPAVVPQNPGYKSQVGEFIYEYVEKIAGEEKAPKITGMLIDLPIEEIKGYLTEFTKLQGKIAEANSLLSNQ